MPLKPLQKTSVSFRFIRIVIILEKLGTYSLSPLPIILSRFTSDANWLAPTTSLFFLNSELEEILKNVSENGGTLDIPLPEGGFDCFKIKPSSVMHPKLTAKCPHIISYYPFGRY